MTRSAEVDLMKGCLKDTLESPLLTRAAEEELFQRIEQNENDRDAMIRLTRANLRLVIDIAQRHAPKAKGLPLLELIQEGNLGLLDAVKLYDWQDGFRFSAFASGHVADRIKRLIATGNASSDIEVEENEGQLSGDVISENMGLLRKVFFKLDAQAREVVSLMFGLDGNAPCTINEMAGKLGITPKSALYIRERMILALKKEIGRS